MADRSQESSPRMTRRHHREALAHLHTWIVEPHQTRAALRDNRVRTRKDRPEEGVETPRDFTSELDMLLLILADRDEVGSIKQDVRCLQHRVGEHARSNRLEMRSARFELDHPLQPPHGCNTHKQPR